MQTFYEAPALNDLAAHLDLETCRTVLEFGCGTGRFAEELFETRLPPHAIYVGRDISKVMVRLAKERLAGFAPRATIEKSDGVAQMDCPDDAFDRFVCTFVMDLLSDADAQAVMSEVRRVLTAGGLAGLVSLTNGTTPMPGLSPYLEWPSGGIPHAGRWVPPDRNPSSGSGSGLEGRIPKCRHTLRHSLRDRCRKENGRILSDAIIVVDDRCGSRTGGAGPGGRRPRVRSAVERPAKGMPDCWAAIRLEAKPVAENDALRLPGKDLLVGVAHVAPLRPEHEAKVGRYPASRRAYAHESCDKSVRLAEPFRFVIHDRVGYDQGLGVAVKKHDFVQDGARNDRLVDVVAPIRRRVHLQIALEMYVDTLRARSLAHTRRRPGDGFRKSARPLPNVRIMAPVRGSEVADPAQRLKLPRQCSIKGDRRMKE